MNVSDYHIILLFNDDSHIEHGSEQDILAVQSTAATSRSLYEALVNLGYSSTLMSVRDSLEDLSVHLNEFSPTRTLIFNNCDGFDGSNQAASLITRLLEEKGFCHTGASAEAVELCINKPLAKERLIQHHIPTPGFQVFLDPGQEFHLQFPVIVKPSVEDGSIGISLKSVVSTVDKLHHQVKMVLETYDEPVLVEEFIVGRELAVAMLGNDPIETLPITEDDYSRIKDPLKQLLTYESKWDEKSRYFNLIPSQTPAILSSEEERLVKKTAKNTFRAVGLRDFGRVDIRLKDGVPYVIDINEVPDLAMDAGFWNSARAAGYTYPQMVDKIVKYALHREGWLQ